ncbi:hypothetical protein MTP99_003744 [Tenebrio molitor]|uniref:chymotrypsin-1-like n=1 Tax=Tenebrio molitor TaxID=7067 RepID=UPI00270E1A39|nr:hypothetical protein MTP99_003744 [Tenebrio molitor]
MNFIFLIPLTLIIMSSSCALPSVQVDDETKIVGGFEGNKEDYPYVVSLRSSKNDHFCGGTLIDDQHVVTAAHCIIGDVAKFVVVGSDSLDGGGIRYEIVSKQTHPDYDPQAMRNDIAVLKIVGNEAYKASFPKRMQVELSSYEDPCYVMGWGLTEAGGKLSNKFKVATVQPVRPEDCKKKWEQLYNPGLICMSSEGNAACHGDSGGPLICENQFSGVVSFGQPCATGKPDVYTAVNSYNEWIDSAIKK